MSSCSGDSTEQPRADRVPVALPVDILVGRGRDGSFAKPLKLSGVTVNVSRSGLLARVDNLVPRGTFCVVRFLVGEDEVVPETLRATVRRTVPTETGGELAVEFETPLEELAAIDSMSF